MIASPQAALNHAAAMAPTAADTVGIGIDLVSTDLVRSAVQSGGQAFLDLIWTDTEQDEAAGSAERLASRWAAKEAVMKALNHGIGEVDPLDIEIRKNHEGGPIVFLRKSAASIAESKKVHAWHISMSHEQDWAVAVATACRPHPDRSSGTIQPTELPSHE